MKPSNPKSRFRSQVIGVLLSLVVIITVCVLSLLSNSENKKVIQVCRLVNDIGPNSLIKESDIECRDMYYKEFKNCGTQKLRDGSTRATIVTWEKRKDVIGKRYTASFLYGGTDLRWNMTTTEQSRRHSYLYSMDGELVNIKMDTKDFGEMVVPGDVINVRTSYKETFYDLPDEEMYMLAEDTSKYSEGVTKDVEEMLFNEVTVLDMLNSNGESIYDIYYNFISMSRAKQLEMWEDENFKSSIEPKSILLQVTAEEAKHFMKVSSKGATYLMTLLPRTSSNAILDSLSDIDKLIKSKK